MNDDQNVNDPNLMDPDQVPEDEIEDLQQGLSEEEPNEDTGVVSDDEDDDTVLA